MFSAKYFFLVALAFAISIIGCSSSNGPTMPSGTSQTAVQSYDNLQIGVSERDSDGNPLGGYGALGVFSIHLDSSTLYGEINPIRNGALTDVLEVVDITNFLQIAPCINCAKLMGVQLDPDGNLVAKIGIKHPFDVGDPYKPITGRNRADLHVFNVEGLVISDGTATMNFPALGKTIGNVGLMNADGYSSYLDTVLDNIYQTVATIHPYILHFDDYSSGNFLPSNAMGFESVTTPPPSGNLVMAMGCDYDVKDYVFNMNGTIDFIYAVGCSYAVSSASKSERFNPEYRVPQHNKKAASEVRVEIVDNQLADGDENSSAQLNVMVVDINHGVAVGSSLNEMLANSSVASVMVEVPGVTSSSVSFGNTPASGTGHDPSNPLVFSGTIFNSAQASEGIYTGLVKVLDTYQPGLNTSPLLNSADGIKRVDPIDNPLTGTFDISEFATYTMFTISVEVRNMPPVCGFFACGDPITVNVGSHVRIDASSSYDTDGTVELYEWDMNYDGVNFNVDTTGVYSWFEGVTAGTYDVGLRVTDDNAAQSDICAIEIECTGDPRGWQTPVRVTTTDIDYYDRLQYPCSNAMAMSSDCKLHLVYFTWKTTYPYERDVLYTYYDGTTWSEPEHIYDFDNSYVMTTAMVLDSNDKIHASFCISNQIWYANNVGGTFDVQSIDSGVSGYDGLSMAINDDDDIMIVASDNSWAPYSLHSNWTYHNSGSGFGARMNAGDYCSSRNESSGVAVEPDICSSPDGYFHLVYNGLRNPPCPASDWNREVYYSEFDGSTWIPHGPVSNFSGDCHQPRVYSDLNNNIYCVVGGGSYIYFGKKSAGTDVWTTFDYITPANYLSYQPDFEIDQWGRGHLVYTQTARVCYYKSFDVNASIADIRNEPTVQIPRGGGGDMVLAHVHVDFDGNVHVAFEDETLGTWVNTELYYIEYR